MSKEKVVQIDNDKVRWTGYISLFIAIILFSGIFKEAEGPLRMLDFTNLLGNFGSMGSVDSEIGKIATDFRGIGGTGPKDAFLFTLTLAPTMMFALGIIKIVENLDGMKAAQKILTPITKPLLGLPGKSGLAIVASLQSADAAAIMTKDLKDSNQISEKQQLILGIFEFSSPATLVNYFSLGSALLLFLDIPISIPLCVIILVKVIGANIMRVVANTLLKEEK